MTRNRRLFAEVQAGHLSVVPPGSQSTTVPDVADIRSERRSHRVRQAALGLLALLVLLGLTGTLGVRSRTVTAVGGDGMEARLTYPQVARPALAVPYELVVTKRGGFDQPVEVRVTLGFLESFDENGVNPEPAESTTDGDDVVWTFDPPPGEDLTLSLDTRVEPGVQWRRRGTTTVSTGTELVSFDHSMWILP